MFTYYSQYNRCRPSNDFIFSVAQISRLQANPQKQQNYFTLQYTVSWKAFCLMQIFSKNLRADRMQGISYVYQYLR